MNFEFNRYTVSFDVFKLPTYNCDILIVGSGLSALRTLIGLDNKFNVIIANKGKDFRLSNSFLAQGGIAAPIANYDNVEYHIQDTIKVGSYLNDERIVRKYISMAKELILELIQWGVPFDTKNTLSESDNLPFQFGLEAGHSKPRILHAKGDTTGRALTETLFKKVSSKSNVLFLNDSMLVDLLVNSNNEVMGGIFFNKDKGLFAIYSSYTVIATGGATQIYRESTSALTNTGDGIAAAFRKGAVITDLEFVQFHPTCLYIAGAPRILISETVRGEGAVLRNILGEEFSKKYHPDGDLAPRDELARIISWEMEKTKSSYVYLDLKNLSEEFVQERFPTLYNNIKMFNIDIKYSFIPVRPAAHYFVGGIKIDEFCRTNIERLFAVGEASCSGFHGANRLGSNSLLECLIHGKIVSDFINNNFSNVKLETNIKYTVQSKPLIIDFMDVQNSLKSLLIRNVGILRNETLLKESLNKQLDWMNYILHCEFNTQLGIELQNMLTVAYFVTRSALIRTKSIGLHYRTDGKEGDTFNSKQHIEVSMKNL